MTYKIKYFLKEFLNFEKNYFTVGGVWKEFEYFLRQGNIYKHIKDRIKFRIYPRLKIVPKFPTHVDIEAASLCQMRCQMCFTTHMDDDLKGVMSWELFTKLVDECASEGVYSVRLSWRGESLLNKRIVDMVEYAKKAGIPEVSFLTNGELLTDEISKRLINAKINWISISADGVDSVYEDIRAPAIFLETVEKVKRLKQLRDDLSAQYPLIRVQSIASAASENMERFYQIWKPIADRINLQSDENRDFNTLNKDDYEKYYFCDHPWTRITIAHSGKVHNCVADYSGKFVWGDASQESIRSIWNGDNANKSRMAFVNHNYYESLPPCSNCSRGLKMTPKKKHSIGNNYVELAEYRDLQKVVKEGSVTISVPLEKLTSRIKKRKGLEKS